MTTATVAVNNKCIACKLHFRKIRASVALPALSEVFAGLKYASILGGNTAKADEDRFSYWAAEPKEVFEFRAGQKEPFGKLQRTLEKYKLAEGPADNLPKGIFHGGWVGYFGYELGRYIEKLPETTIDDLQMPLIRLCFYDKVICYDHIENSFWLIALELPNDTKQQGEKLAALESLLAESQKISVKQPPPSDLDNIEFSQIRCNMDKDYYLKTIKKIKRYIYDGDVYQVNFSSDLNATITPGR